MTLGAFGAYMAVQMAATASPGPAVVALIHRSLGEGRAAGIRFGLGLAVGASAWLLAALLGVAAILRAAPALATALSLGGGAYLLWLAWRMWAGARHAITAKPVAPRSREAFLAGIRVNLSNPKPALFFASIIVTLFPDGLRLAEKALLYVAMLTWECGFFALFAVLMTHPRLRARYFKAKPMIDRISALALAALGLSLILRH